MKAQIEYVKIGNIIPDKNQPRTYFDAAKMRFLRNSILKHGIKTPLSVEKLFGDKYQLLDGERRFRASTELGLTEVPVIVEPLKTELERLVLQFQIQQQHEGWLPVEKAVALGRIAELTNVGIKELCDQVDIPSRTAQTYLAFFQLKHREEFARNEIPLEFAASIRGLKAVVKRLYQDKDQIFTDADANRLEKVLINKIKSGVITTPRDMVKIRDAVVKSNEAIYTFMDSKTLSPEELFSKTKAKGAWYLRNVRNASRLLGTYIHGLAESGDVELDEETVKQLRYAKKQINYLLNIAGKE